MLGRRASRLAPPRPTLSPGLAAGPHCPWWPKPLKAEHRRLPDSEYIDAKKTLRCCILSRNAPQEETVAVEQNKRTRTSRRTDPSRVLLPFPATLATPSRRAKERPEKANAVFPHAASVGNCPDFRTSNANLHPPSSPAFRTILPDTRRSALDFARFLLFFRQMQF